MLKGKTAFITGTNRGLGRTLLTEFVRNGANVIAHVRSECRVKSDDDCSNTIPFDEWCDQVAKKYGVFVRPIYFDMTDYDAMESSVEKLIDEGIRIDVLINNAGVGKWGYFQLMSMDVVRSTMEVNLFAPMTLTQHLLRYMISKGGGSIVNIASIAGIDLNAGNCAYGVSKAALVAFTKTLAAEAGIFKVRVNAIAPGMMKTDMGNILGEKEAERSIKGSPLNRLCTVEDVASAAVFLSSDRSSYINGQVIVLDGGKR